MRLALVEKGSTERYLKDLLFIRERHNQSELI